MQGQRKSISHTMELPRQIVVGENNIEEVGVPTRSIPKFKESFNNFRKKC